MTTRRSFTRLLGFLIVVLGAAASGLASQPAPAASAEAAGVAPRISRRVTSRLRSTIESGFQLAVQKLSTEPGCRDLFAELGADGREMLSTTLYYQADLKTEKQVCSRALAFTIVGGAPTWVCQRFARLNDRRAAAVLLHEALHHAGMGEWPNDPDGPTPAEIDELVADACGF
jgi:hypothetical protein